MSMRLQAKLQEKLSSHVEGSYLRQQDLVVLENVAAEMTFKTSQAFMEHESQQHEYLPCFHMMGEIKEIRGDFPFNVSALYFSDADKQRLMKDIIYYPSPDELAHIIQTGKFYSRHFAVPPILSDNTYTLPCKVNLMIVPPPNQAAYESSIMSNFSDLEEEEKVNLPLFYVGLLGTGVSRKNDKLLDYYGIDMEPGYDHFVLTAESSGYTDPPLLQYMEEPAIEEDMQKVNMREYYITPEEEAEMLHSAAERQQMAEREASAQVSLDAQADFHEATPEDAIIARSDRLIMSRMEEKFGGRRLSLEAKREHDRQAVQHEMPAMESVAEPSVVEEEPHQESAAQPENLHTEAYDASMFIDDDAQVQRLEQPDMPQQQAEVKMDLNTEGNDYVIQAREEQKEEHPDDFPDDSDRHETAMLEGADVDDAEAQTKVDEAHARDLALDAAVQQQVEHLVQDEQPKPDEKRPVDPQQQVDVTMDLDPEHNAYVQTDRDKNPADRTGTPSDRTDVEHMAGADVADAEAQTKVDEAHTRDVARDAVQAAHQHREAPELMQQIADRYDSSRSDNRSKDSDEYI